MRRLTARRTRACRLLVVPAVLFALTVPSVTRAEGPNPAQLGRAYYYFSLAQQDRIERRYRDAIAHLKSAVAFDPESVTLHLELARIYWLLRNKTNDYEKSAEEQGEAAVKLDPESLDAHRFLAILYGMRSGRGIDDDGSLALAIGHLEKARELAPEYDRNNDRLDLGKLYQQAGRPGDSIQVLEALIEQDPRSVEGLYWLSKAYYEDGQMGRAVSPLERAINLSPQSVHLSEALAELQEKRGDIPAAIEATQFLISRAPDGLLHYVRLAGLYREAGQMDKALEVFDRAEQIARSGVDPDYTVAMVELNLARIEVLLQAGQPKEALQVALRAVDESPDSVRLALALGQLKYRTGDQSGGVATLDEVLESRRGDERVRVAVSNAFLALGAQQERAGDSLESERLLERSIAAHPENHTALNYLGYMWADRGDKLDQSVKYIERALRIGGEIGAYLDSLGWAYYRQKRYDLAEPQLVRAAELESEEAEIQDHLGDLYHAMGRVPEAIEAWKRAIQNGSENTETIQFKIDQAEDRLESEP